jgi:Flp pilus assembly secretin CpaC
MRIRLLVVIVLAGLALGTTASPAAADVRRVQVEIKTRIVEVTRGQVRDLGIRPGIFAGKISCDPGEVALMAGASVDRLGVSVLSSLPTGPRAYRLELGNFNLEPVTAALSALCARVLDAPRIGVGTGTVEVTVPGAHVEGTGLVAGTARVTGTCSENGIPVSSGADLGSEGVLRLAQSFPSGPRKLIVIVRNFALDEKQAMVAVRCVDLPGGFGVTRHTVSAAIPAATGAGASIEPGEKEGTQKCPTGKALIGGGYRAPENAVGDSFPALRGVPVLGYLFRNFSSEPARGDLVIFCTPKVVRTGG